MRSSVGRRKPTNVKRRLPSKPKLDSESDSESLPDVLRESKSRSVSEEEEKENKSVMSSTDGGQRAVKSLRSRARKQNTTNRIPQKTSSDLTESQTDIFDSLSDADHRDGEGSSEGNQDADIISKLQKEAKIVTELILEREKGKSSTKTSENGSQNDSVIEDGVLHLNGVDSTTDEDSVKQGRDIDEDDDDIPKSPSFSKKRSGAKTSSKDEDVEIIEDNIGEGDEEIETDVKSSRKQASSKEEEEDVKETGGGVEDGQEEKCGSKGDDVVSRTRKGKNVTENGEKTEGDEIAPEDNSQSSNDEAVVDNDRRTSRRKQMKEKIQRVEEDGGEMESVEDMEEESVDEKEKKTRLRKRREDGKSKIKKENKSESDEEGDDESTAEEDKTGGRELRKRKNEDKHKLERKQRKVSEEDESSNDEEEESRNKRKLRRRKNQRGKESEDSSQVDQSSDESDASYDASSANDFLQDFKGIRCTSCYQQLNQFNRKSLCQHPTLGVLICRRCVEYYHEGDFTKDDEGADEQCQWCGEGGNLICCDFCPAAFCKTCICRNLSRKEWTAVSTNETAKWHCYVCNRKPISDLIKSCRAVVRWAEKSSKGVVAPSKPIRRDDTTRDSISKPYKQLCAYLEGKSESWNYFQNELEKKKKSVSQMKKKELLHAILNIRSFRKYLKSYQDHFEHSLEEIMSSGEISGGETATDSMTAKEDTGLNENGEGNEKEMEENSSDDEEMATPKKKEKSVRRIKTTPKRNSVGSDRENSISKQAESKDQDTSDGDDGDDDATTLEEDEGMKEGSGDEMKDDSKQKEKDAEATDEKKTRKSSKVEPKVSKRKNKEKMSEEGEEDGDSEKTSDEKDEKKTDKSTKETAKVADEEEDSVSLIDIEEDTTLTDGTEDGKNQASKESGQVSKNAGKAEGRSIDKDDKPQTKGNEEEEEPSNGASPDEPSNSTKGKKLSRKSAKEKKEKEVVSEDGKQEDIETKEEEKGDEDDDEDFEKMLLDDIESNDEDSEKEKVNNKSKKVTKKKDDKSEGSSDKEGETLKTSKTKGVKARKSLSKDYKKNEEKESKVKSSKYVETGSTSDTEVSLIDLDIADEQERKRKKLKKKQKKTSNSDSDTDIEVEKLVEKVSKRKKQLSTDEDSQQEVEKASGTKKEKEKSSSNKRRRKGSSSSDIDSEIDRLDDLNFRSSKKGKSRGSKKQPSKQKDKKKKTGKKSSTSDDDSDEELPEINYDTDPELLVNKSQKKEDIKLEDAEEQYAEKMLVKELESDEKNDDNESSSDSEGDKNGEVKKKSKGGGKEGKGEKKSESENGKRGSKKATDGSDDDKGSSQSEKSGKKKKAKKVHKLLKGKLISSSSSDSGEEWGKKKKKLNEMLKKEGKSSESGKKKKNKKGKEKSGKSDSDFTISDSSDSSVGKKKNKRNKSQSSGDDSDSSDDSMRRRRVSKRKRKESDSDNGSSDDFAKERKKLRSYQQGVKEKKKSRIKQAFSSGSDSDVVGKKQKGSDDLGSDIEDSQEKGKGRKKIRKLMKKKQLTKETIDAAEEERERRKRVQKKRQELIAKEMDSPQKSSVLQEIVLDRDPETNEVLLEIDKKLVKVLKPHQAKGIQFMWDCTFENLSDAGKPGGGCILAHCMGLGKTLQVIAFLHAVMLEEKTGVDTALVVAPLNTVLNWEAEFEKWQEGLEYEINVFELASYKDNASRADVLKQWQREGGVMIMGYTMYRNLCQSRFVKKKRQKEVFAETLVNPGPDLVVCDEGHLLKNDATATAIAMNNIRTRRRICLTGTPLQNNLIEYHCMVQFVKPMLLGTRKEFSNRFVNPISNGQCADSSPYDVKLMKKRAHILHNLLSGSVQRKDYSALAPYLPPKHEYVVLIRLSKKQIELYERYLENYGAGTGGGALEGRPTSLFKDYQVLMNVWTHPRLLKLAAIRTEKKRQSEEMKTFIDDVETEVDTSEEEEVVEHVRDSSSEDEIMQAAEEKGLADLMNVPGTSGEQNNGRRRKKSGSGDSDSSVEVIKTWNTRRTRGDGEDDFMEDFPPPPPKKEWFTDLVDDEDNLKIEISGKMILLFEILKLAEAVGEKVLLFSQSLLTLDLIEDLLEDQALKNVAENAEKRHIKLASSEEIEIEMETYDTWVKGIDYFRIDGSTEAHTRKAMSDKFNNVQNIRSRLFLVSTRAGSLGINLVAASRVIIFDACWNPSHDIQSIFRVYRFGQEKAVYIYRFIAQGTMEERIYDRQVTKQSLAQRVVDEHQVKRHYTFTELNELYNFQPDRLDDPDRKEQPTPILPKDFILAELLHCQKDWIVNYHEHDSLLENVVDESLTEEERKAAWSEYEAEKEGRIQQMVANPSLDQVPGMPMPMSEQLRQMQQRMPHFNHGFLQRFAQASQYHNANNASNPGASPFMSMARILQLSNQAAQQNQGQSRPQLPGSYTLRIPGIRQPVITHRIPPPSMNLRPGLPGQTRPGLPGQAPPGLPGQTRPGVSGQGHPQLPGQASGLPGQAGLSSSSILMQALSRQAQSEKSSTPTSSVNHVIKIHPGTPQPPSDGDKKS